MHNTALIVPALNAGGRWREWRDAFEAQTFRPRHLLVIDSSSEDDTVRLAREAGFEVHSIPQCEFDHGGTRQLSVQMVPDAEIVAFLTQDAVLVDPYDVDAIAEGLQRLVEDTALREGLRRKGIEHTKRFSWDSCANTTMAILEGIRARTQ